MTLYKLSQKFKSLFYYMSSYFWYKAVFKKIGWKTRIFPYPRLEYPENISIGKNVHIGKNCWLAASPNLIQNPVLIIEDKCVIGSMNQIYSTSRIVIEKSVITADRVYISDGTHNYSNITLPILKQGMTSLGEMIIGEGSWIGTNVCILGASIGKNCVIGANTVVNRDIPDYCVAVGSPAKIIKRYDLKSEKWCKTNNIGEFIY